MATKKATSTKKTKQTTKAAKAKPVTTKVAEVTVAETAAPAAVKSVAKATKPATDRTAILGAAIAEFIGMFVLAGATVLSKGSPLYITITLIGVVLMLGSLSGAHVNPVVTLGAWATRKISSLRAVAYLSAQVIGAMLALVVMGWFISAAPQNDLSAQAAMYGGQGATQLFEVADLTGGKEVYVLVAELIGAAILGFALSSAMREKHDRVATALTYGFSFCAAFVIASVAASYASANVILNPAVAFTLGAIDWNNISSQLWPFLVYILAPLIGGTLGFFIYDLIRSESDGGDDKLITDEL